MSTQVKSCDTCGADTLWLTHVQTISGEASICDVCAHDECDCDNGVYVLGRWLEACETCGRFDTDDEAAGAYVALRGGAWAWEHGKYDDGAWQHPLWSPPQLSAAEKGIAA